MRMMAHREPVHEVSPSELLAFVVSLFVILAGLAMFLATAP